MEITGKRAVYQEKAGCVALYLYIQSVSWKALLYLMQALALGHALTSDILSSPIGEAPCADARCHASYLCYRNFCYRNYWELNETVIGIAKG